MPIDNLLQRCVQRDGQAWDEFVRKYQGIVKRSVSYKLSRLSARVSRSEVADIVQDIFLSLWEKNRLIELRDPKCLTSWLIMISVNRASNYHNSRAVRESSGTIPIDSEIGNDDNSLSIGDTLPSLSFDTNRIFENRDLMGLIKRNIGALAHKERLAVKLSLYDGKRQKEIAEIMNIPENSAATLIRRGKEKLRERLTEAMKENRG